MSHLTHLSHSGSVHRQNDSYVKYESFCPCSDPLWLKWVKWLIWVFLWGNCQKVGCEAKWKSVTLGSTCKESLAPLYGVTTGCILLSSCSDLHCLTRCRACSCTYHAYRTFSFSFFPDISGHMKVRELSNGGLWSKMEICYITQKSGTFVFVFVETFENFEKLVKEFRSLVIVCTQVSNTDMESFFFFSPQKLLVFEDSLPIQYTIEDEYQVKTKSVLGSSDNVALMKRLKSIRCTQISHCEQVWL